MKMITKNDKIVAMVFGETWEDGTRPLTDGIYPLQIIALKHPKGKVLLAHTHRPTERKTNRLMEALFVTKGLARVTVYHEGASIETIDLSAGQGIMMIDGGLGVEILEDAEMFEFKNGPFIEDKELL